MKDRFSEGLKKEMAVRALFLANYIAFANKSSCEEDNLEIDKKFSLLCEVDNISREISKEIDRIGGVEFVDDKDIKLNHVDRIVYDLSDEAEDYLENEGRVNDIPVSGNMVEYAKEFKENDSYDYYNMTQYIDVKNEVFNTKEYLDRFSIVNLHQLSYETKK